MKIKVGIITICKCNNYGAELQAFATLRKLQLMGYDAELIDYVTSKNWRFKNTIMSRPVIRLSYKSRFVNYLKYKIVQFLLDVIFPIFNTNVNNRKVRFNLFHKENSKFSTPFYSMPALYAHHFDYDVYIVGSDQVWNPASSSSIEPYFLTFAPIGTKKISFASSFGISEIPSVLKPYFSKLLSNIDNISVRESVGKVIIQDLTGRYAEWLVDPTLLLDKAEWMEVAKPYPNIESRYIVIYQLAQSDFVVNLAKRIGEKLNIPVYRICKRAAFVENNEGIGNIKDAGPAEFLWLVANASFMITDSFHGTAFSINLGIPFYTVIPKIKNNSSRIKSLLSLVGLEDRMIIDINDIENMDISVNMPFDIAHKVLQEERKRSEFFLIDAVEK